MFRFLRANFDRCLQDAKDALERGDHDRAVQACLKAINSDEDGVKKLLDVALTTSEGDSIDDKCLIQLFSEVLKMVAPRDSKTWVACAAAALTRGDTNSFWVSLTNVEQVISEQSTEQQMEISIRVYWLLRECWKKARLLFPNDDFHAHMGIYGKASEYGATVLDRIELADSESPVAPSAWEHYIAICEFTPKLNNRAVIARKHMQH